MRQAREKRGGGDDHAVGAVAALGGLLRDERRLHPAGATRIAQTFESHDLFLAGIDREGHAGARRRSVDEDAAGAALAEAATELRATQPEIVAQGVE